MPFKLNKKAKDIFLKGLIGSYRYIPAKRILPLRKINLEITWDCNLNCVMCPRLRAQNFRIKDKNMSLEEFKYIVKNIPHLKHINIVGAGEPLVNPYFYDMLDFANSKGITISFTTNGTLLNENNINKLPKNVKYIYFSVDSLEKEIYSGLRGGLRSLLYRISRG